MKAIYNFISNKCNIDLGFKYCKSNEDYLSVRRDEMGLQHIYYSQLPTQIIFSTSLREILPYLAYPSIDEHSLAEAVRFNYPIDVRQTWIRQIKRLLPGEEAIVTKDGIRLQTYWKRDYSQNYVGTKKQALETALDRLRESVKKSIESSDGPVAVLLSGGIDSSSLAILSQEFQQEVHVFSAGYKGSYYCDERAVAQKFSKEKKLIYHEIELDINDFKKFLNDSVKYIDEPCFDVSCIPQFALYQKIAQMGFRTILSGIGGDELFFSYKCYNEIVESLRLKRQFQNLCPVKKHIISYIKFFIKNPRFVLFPNHPILIDEKFPVAWTYDDYVKFARTASLKCKGKNIKFSEIDVQYHFSDNLTITKMYDFIFSTFMTNLCVYLGDKLSEANGTSIKFPFLDKEFVSFIDSLPLEYKYNLNEPKMFQKEMMKGILPDYILFTKKRGFEPPFEFIREIASEHEYKHINTQHSFFNSMVADMIIDNFKKSLV